MRVRRQELRRRGTAAVEMAVILPVFLMMVLGLIEASRLGMAAQLISAAAREGCRVATLASATNNDFVTKAVQDALAGSGISATPTISCGDGTSSVSATAPAGGTTITVTVSVPYSQIAWFAPVEYFQGVTVKASVTMSSERP